jgi:hypothetical protein
VKLQLLANEKDFISFDLIPKGEKEVSQCIEIVSFFKAGNLRVSVEQSCLIIEYGGENHSFTINERERKAFEEGIIKVWHGEHKFMIGSCFDSCKFIFNKPKRPSTAKIDYCQKRLISLYAPPPAVSVKRKTVEEIFKKIKVDTQERLIDQEPNFLIQPLFEAVGASISQQVVLEV